jgi:tetratricopeptide (TPR) repeat protein
MPETQAQQLYRQAIQLVKDQHLEGARDICLQLCEIDRHNPSAWMLLGTINGQLGLYADAANCFCLQTELDPSQATAHLNLGKSLHALGNLDAAAESYAKSLVLRPQLAEAWFNLGQLRGTQKQFAAAEDCFRKLLAIETGNAAAYHGLGAALEGQERWEDAADSYRLAIQLQPDFPEALNNLGVTLQKTGELDVAIKSYSRALSINPDYGIARYNMGTALHELGKFTEAKNLFLELIELNPEHKEACTALGRTLHTLGRFTEGIRFFQQALSIDECNGEALIGLGNACQAIGRFSEAYDAYAKAAAIDPDSVVAIASQADILEKQNNIQGALELIQPLLARQVTDSSLANTYATTARKTGQHEQACAVLEKAMNVRNIPATERAELHFSMGRLLDDMQDYERAFDHFEQANNLLPYAHDPEVFRGKIDSLIRTFSTASLRQLPRANGITDRPVFIVAMPRSGTSLVEQILSSHPDVYGGGELPYISAIPERVCSLLGSVKPFPYCILALTRDVANMLSEEYLGQLSSLSQNALRITDKMPHNFLYLGLIEILFPDARIIHCTRNPMDTCLSIYTQGFNANHGYATNLAHLGRYYRQYQRLMEHWKSVLSIPILEINYEDLASRQEELSRKLVDFCGLEWNEACLDFHTLRRDVATPSYEQVRKPMYQTSIERWKNYERHLGPLLQALSNPD